MIHILIKQLQRRSLTSSELRSNLFLPFKRIALFTISADEMPLDTSDGYAYLKGAEWIDVSAFLPNLVEPKNI
jgi:hypothetical protein